MENPFVNVLRYLETLPKRKKTSNRSKDNFERIVNDYHPDSNKAIRDKVILLLNYRYKLRPSEIVGLNLENVNLEAGLITVPSRKKHPLRCEMMTSWLFVNGAPSARCINAQTFLRRLF